MKMKLVLCAVLVVLAASSVQGASKPELEERIKRLEKAMIFQLKRVQELEDEIEELKAEPEITTNKTAFMAFLSGYANPVATGALIPWDAVVYDDGHHFNTSIGAYITPVTGLYQFSVHTEDHYWIVFNYAGQPSFNESDPVNVSLRGSTTATIPLPAGTVVQVQNYNATTVYGSDVLGVYSWFSGFLLSTK